MTNNRLRLKSTHLYLLHNLGLREMKFYRQALIDEVRKQAGKLFRPAKNQVDAFFKNLCQSAIKEEANITSFTDWLNKEIKFYLALKRPKLLLDKSGRKLYIKLY